MSDRHIQILGLGTVTIDHVMRVAHYPKADSKNDANGSHLQMGGPVPIALSQLRRFGHHCHFISAWGGDQFGMTIEQRLSAEGIGYAETSGKSVSTSVTQIWLDESTGERTLVTQRADSSTVASTVSAEIISSFDVLHLDGWATDAAIRAAELMKEQGGIVCLDTGSPKPSTSALLALADVVNCPRRFCEDYFNESDPQRAVEKLSSMGPQVVTVTDGERGAVIRMNGKTLTQAAYSFGRVVDTNGAGDSFSGALIHGYLNAWEPEKILRFATACASLKCTQLGNANTLPGELEVWQALNSLD